MAEQIITLRVEDQGVAQTERLLQDIVDLLKEQQKEQQKLQKQVTDTGKKGKESFTDFRKALDETLNIVKNFGTIFSKVFGEVFTIFKEQTEIAAKFVDNISQMEAALNNIPTEKTAQDFVNFTDKLALATGQSQDYLFELSKLSVQLTNSTDHTEEMTKASIAISKAVGVDAKLAIRGMTQTLNGQTGALARYLPELSTLTKEQLKAGEAINLINERFGPALEARLNTTTGQYERLTNIIGDRYLEVLGLSIADNKAFAEGMRVLGDELAAIAPKVEDLMPIMQNLVVSGLQMVLGLSNAVQTFNALINDMIEPLGILGDAIVKAFVMPLELVFDQLKKITNALDQFGLLPESLSGFMAESAQFFEDLDTAASDSLKAFSDGLNVAAKGAEKTEAILNKTIQAIENFEKTTTKSNKNRNKQQKQNTKELEKEEKAWKKWVDQQVKAFEKALIAQERYAAETKREWENHQKDIESILKTMAEQTADFERKQSEARISTAKAIGGSGVGTITALVSGDSEQQKEAITSLLGGVVSGIGEAVMGLFDTFLKALEDPAFLEGLIESISNMIQALGDKDNIMAVVEGLTGLIQNVISALAEPDFIMNIIDGFIKLLLNIIQILLENLPQILSNIVRAVLKGIGDFIEGLIEMLAQPDFISKFVVGIVNLIIDVIFGIARLIDRIVFAILKNLLPIVIEVFKAVVKAIAQLFLRGMWEVVRLIIRIASFGTVDIGEAPGSDKANQTMMESGDQKFHNGGIFRYAHNGRGLAPGERVIAQDGEAMVIPIGPKKFNGMSTDGRGNIQRRGSSKTINVTINAIDSQSFEDMLRRKGLSVLIDMIEENVEDNRKRSLKAVLNK